MELEPMFPCADGRAGEERWGVTKYSAGPRWMRGGVLPGARAAVLGIGVSAYVKSECAESKFNTRGGGAACWGVEAVWGRPFGELGDDVGFGGDRRKRLGGEASG